MPNIASLLREEITRLARKQVRAETEALQKASANYRSAIANLKRDVAKLERELAQARKAGGKAKPETETQEAENLRFRPEGMASHRKRLGLSAVDFGKLIGVSGQTVYKWEQRKARPRAAQMAVLSEIRRLGKKAAHARLETLA